VLLEAARVYGRFPIRVVGTASAVFVPVVAGEAFIHGWAEHAHDAGQPAALFVVLAVAGSTALADTVATIFFAAVMDTTVVAHRRHQAPPPIHRILLRLPYGPLLIADLIAGLAAGAGAFVGVLPGLVIFTLLSIVAPVILIERLGPFAALRRSARLTWTWFATSLVAVTLPATLEGLAVEQLIAGTHGLGSLPFVVAAEVFGITIGAFVGLCEVALGHALVRADHARTLTDAGHEDGAAPLA
jgi:hypothetical protein